MTLYGLYLAGCALLFLAGVAKAWRPRTTALALSQSFQRFGRWVSAPAVRTAALLEAMLGAAGLIWPNRALAAGVAASYALFGFFVLHARRRGGALATCGCFGQPDTPPTRMHVVADAVALSAAASVAWAAPHGTVAAVLGHQYAEGIPLAAASVAATWLAYLVLVPLARLQWLQTAQPVPGRAR